MSEAHDSIDPEAALAISYAQREARAGLRALLGLDVALGRTLQGTREPLVGQMRLAWWHEALTRLDAAPPPAEPVLQALAAAVLPYGVTGMALAGMVDGWEMLLDPAALDNARMRAYADARGGALFVAAARLCDEGAAFVRGAGAGWALADLARHLSDPVAAQRARALAGPMLQAARPIRWPRSLRAVGALTHLARLDLAAPPGTAVPTGAPNRVARLLWHRLTGK